MRNLPIGTIIKFKDYDYLIKPHFEGDTRLRHLLNYEDQAAEFANKVGMIIEVWRRYNAELNKYVDDSYSIYVPITDDDGLTLSHIYVKDDLFTVVKDALAEYRGKAY